ncbi:MAG: hypothetical protein AAF989_17040, partial [Planctomycetota bacterium]
EKIFENWRWVYLGDTGTPRVLALVHEQVDEHVDTMAHLGNSQDGLESKDGMVVFGFGRGAKGIEPLLSGKNSFRLQFLEQSGESDEAYQEIRGLLMKLATEKISVSP